MLSAVDQPAGLEDVLQLCDPKAASNRSESRTNRLTRKGGDVGLALVSFHNKRQSR